MIFWIIVAVLILSTLGWWFYLWNDSCNYSWGWYPGALLIVAVFGSLLGGFILAVAATGAPIDHSYDKVEPLKAMANHTSVSGSFFLIYGQVGEEVQINYIAQDPDGGYILSSASPTNVRIFEDDTGPALHTGSIVTSAWWLAPWPWVSLRMQALDFHVPPGTILQEFSIDLSK